VGFSTNSASELDKTNLMLLKGLDMLLFGGEELVKYIQFNSRVLQSRGK